MTSINSNGIDILLLVLTDHSYSRMMPEKLGQNLHRSVSC